MTYFSSLANNMTPLILDTSVLINLHATGCGGSFLKKIPNEIYISEIVFDEFCGELSGSYVGREFINVLVGSGDVVVLSMDDIEIELFSEMVFGISSLDDGEASTIALASSRNYLPVIDERRGRVQAERRCAGRVPAWSIDLIRHPKALENLGEDAALDAIFLALRDGRMRIDQSHCDDIVSLIGRSRALECKSLPGYKYRKSTWMN